jgi:NADH-quinone oxidoreductase subunit E
VAPVAAPAPEALTPAEAVIAARRGDLDRDLLIPLLQEVQEAEGFLSADAMARVAEALDTPVSRVYGVATFYNQFRFTPLGEHVIELCRGTACHVKQSLALARHLKRRLKLRPDGNSADDRFTVIRVACLGACSIAPVIRLDGEFYGHLTSEKLDALLDGVDVDAEAVA